MKKLILTIKKIIYLFYCHFNRNNLTVSFLLLRGPECCHYNLNTSDSGLHHTISLMYEGAHHLGFGTTWHGRRLGGISRVVPIAHCLNNAMFVFCCA